MPPESDSQLKHPLDKRTKSILGDFIENYEARTDRKGTVLLSSTPDKQKAPTVDSVLHTGVADGDYSGATIPGTGGATIAFGDLIYLQASDSRWELVDADAVSTSGDIMIGMAVTSSTDGDDLTILLNGIIRADANFPTLTIGSAVYASTGPGNIQVAEPTGADDVVRVVGFAVTADEIYFNPSPDHITVTG